MLKFSGKAGAAYWTLAAAIAFSSPAWSQTMGGGGGGGTGGGGGGGSSIGSSGGGIGSGGSIGSGGIGTGGGVGTGTGATAGATTGTTAGQASPIKTYVQTATGASASNPIGPYYENPLSYGKPGGSGKATGIWTATYTTTTTPSTGVTANIGTSGLGGTSSQPASILNRRGPAYTVSIAFPVEPPTSSQLQAKAQKVINLSSSLTMKDTIKVKADGETIVLEGQVRSDQEKRLAENLLRLSRIRLVQNNLQVVQASPKPRQLQ